MHSSRRAIKGSTKKHRECLTERKTSEERAAFLQGPTIASCLHIKRIQQPKPEAKARSKTTVILPIYSYLVSQFSSPQASRRGSIHVGASKLNPNRLGVPSSTLIHELDDDFDTNDISYPASSNPSSSDSSLDSSRRASSHAPIKKKLTIFAPDDCSSYFGSPKKSPSPKHIDHGDTLAVSMSHEAQSEVIEKPQQGDNPFQTKFLLAKSNYHNHLNQMISTCTQAQNALQALERKVDMISKDNLSEQEEFKLLESFRSTETVAKGYTEFTQSFNVEKHYNRRGSAPHLLKPPSASSAGNAAENKLKLPLINLASRRR